MRWRAGLHSSRLVAAAAPRHDVVHVQPDSDEPVGALALELGTSSGSGCTRCGASLTISGALEEGFAHEPEVEVLQVAQAAVDQLGGAARGARGEIGLSTSATL